MRPFPTAGINCAVFTGYPRISISGSNYVAAVQYVVATRYQVTSNGVTSWVLHQVPWMLQGSGSVSVTDPQTTPMNQVQTALVTAIATAEGLTTGDFVVLPDATVVTL